MHFLSWVALLLLVLTGCTTTRYTRVEAEQTSEFKLVMVGGDAGISSTPAPRHAFWCSAQLNALPRRWIVENSRNPSPRSPESSRGMSHQRDSERSVQPERSAAGT